MAFATIAALSMMLGQIQSQGRAQGELVQPRILHPDHQPSQYKYGWKTKYVVGILYEEKYSRKIHVAFRFPLDPGLAEHPEVHQLLKHDFNGSVQDVSREEIVVHFKDGERQLTGDWKMRFVLPELSQLVLQLRDNYKPRADRELKAVPPQPPGFDDAVIAEPPSDKDNSQK